MKEKNSPVSELILQLRGVDVSKYDDSFLNKSLQKRIRETHCITEESYYNYLEQNNKEGEYFLDSLNISYTGFFRNPLTFAVLEGIILPSIVLKNANTKRKEIRIWSAACAAGQETYSLAILLEELKNGDNEKMNFRIFATDQDDVQVNEARDGKYFAAALNNVNLKRVNQWFTKPGDTYSVKQELKMNIDFSVFDLFSEQLGCPPASIFGDFDLVVCANLLFYYKPDYQKKILEKTGNCLVNDGYLITGEAERDVLMRHNYREVFPQSAIFQKIACG
ncbi:MAG: protein-glutamate O-methyltransferase CheR [Bacteroidia bacterium]|nr:protein-glutamate O-methyltransferase CheR [Bacteroidia bacterium]